MRKVAVFRLFPNNERPSAAKRKLLATVVYGKLIHAAEVWAYTATLAASSQDALCRPVRSVALIRACGRSTPVAKLDFLRPMDIIFWKALFFVIY